ncbi:NAD(P)H-binding protein [Yinghuangia seranimata]|uniref:NmrA family NAD(P)-binding protein n=1 Tax=Yinghuangia seranimata TaxID=408067 RepID=UPI00248ADADC|nr:NAD(P)H-binding protein [Yinghuangia seranimata]MDI2126422.1 NAD(P)H-binding protein [Yinghuangia seranimata]
MIVVTGATGRLGRQTVESLLARGVAAADIAVAVRDTAKAADLAALGVQVREGDYDRPETLAAAFAGADPLVLVSANAPDNDLRIAQHAAAVAAAAEAGVGRIVYTSIVEADTNPIALAKVHSTTEDAIRATGLPFTFLRNGWYFENYTANLPGALEHGGQVGTAGEGRIAAAAIADYADAAAVVASTDGHAGAVYELTGDASWSLTELAAEVAKQTGTEFGYTDLPAEAFADILTGAGLPAGLVDLLVDAETHTRAGALGLITSDLRTLIGRPTTVLSQAVAEALKG